MGSCSDRPGSRSNVKNTFRNELKRSRKPFSSYSFCHWANLPRNHVTGAQWNERCSVFLLKFIKWSKLISLFFEQWTIKIYLPWIYNTHFIWPKLWALGEKNKIKQTHVYDPERYESFVFIFHDVKLMLTNKYSLLKCMSNCFLLTICTSLNLSN